ncbi:MAG TPA: YciI family protein [Dongiaceae bacterium]|jgi:hypothetical protein|nr:YciI family protein [Dongiaceae bacterium]
MKYLCLCYYDLAKFNALTEAQMAELGRICPPRDQQLKETGRKVLDASLAMPHEVRVIRPSDAGPVFSEGPYVSTPEPLGAFFIVEAETLDEAAKIAAIHPGAHLGHILAGGIEVRPIDHFSLA